MSASAGGTPLARGGAWACVSGALLALAYPRADLGFLALAALVPLLWSLEGASPAGALLRGYLCGAAFFLPLLDWIPGVMVHYGGLPPVVAWLLLALLSFYLASYVALFALFVSRAWSRSGPLALAAAPFVWVALELARARLLTGFPWGLLGYSQYRNLPLLQVSAWGGIYAVSFLVLASNAGLAMLTARSAGGGSRGTGAGLILIVLLAHGGGWWGMRRAAAVAEPGETIEVAAIQGNVPQDRKWQPGSGAAILADLTRLTREAAAGGARLIVWPESSSPLSFRRLEFRAGGSPSVVADTGYTSLVAGLAREASATLIVGSIDYRDGGEVRALNSAFALAPTGDLEGSYDKMHLVPFGEYVPLHRWLFFVDRLARGTISDFTPGERPGTLPTVAGPAATFICYEAIFPELVRRLTSGDAALLVNLTNDAWFGRTGAPAQHLAMAIVRAVENRRYLVRAANTGISAVVDPYGRILARTGLMRSAVLRATIHPRTGRTPYGRWGDVFAWGCAILALLHGAALRAAFVRRG